MDFEAKPWRKSQRKFERRERVRELVERERERGRERNERDARVWSLFEIHEFARQNFLATVC